MSRSSDPYLLTETEEVKERFSQMIEKTLKAILDSYSDGSAYSGMGPYELREKIASLGFLPDEGKGFEAVLE
ncbi:MAG: hypothetical protein IJ248_02340, partial [Candidatus Methanomethylophilaceae archaeon]|nr:hypothetical protein [Candidatus Methanomethylophilaceae archaeon]